MMTLVTGGSASGKSEYAEKLLDGVAGRKCYIATMQPFDSECRARIAKHQEARAHRGFETVERYTDLEALDMPDCGGILLECMSNLAANELYSPNGAGNQAADAIMRGVEMLRQRAERLVIVSNEIFSDGLLYDPQTKEYLSILGEINRRLAALADVVVEVVYTLPLFHKGGRALC